MIALDMEKTEKIPMQIQSDRYFRKPSECDFVVESSNGASTFVLFLLSFVFFIPP